MLAGKETEGFSPRAEATLTNRSVRRGSPNSAAPKVSTAHASAFCNVSVFIPLAPLLFFAPLFFNVRLPYKCQMGSRVRSDWVGDKSDSGTTEEDTGGEVRPPQRS